MNFRVRGWQCFISFVMFGLLMPAIALSQDNQNGSVAILQAANGFKNLKLGAITKLIPGYKITYMDGDNAPDADSCFRYIYQDDDILQLADGVTLDRVGFRTYNNKIVEIYLFFKEQDGYKVLKNFTGNYGSCTDRPTDFTYMWSTGDVNLTLRYKQGLDLGVAVFSSNKMEQLVQQSALKAAALQKAMASSERIAGN